MPQFEPFWDTQNGRWPGLFDINGRRRNSGVIYDTHIGVWCEWSELGGLGVVATSEFQFTSDGRFVWLMLRGGERSDFLVKREGTWQLADETLVLQIETSEEPDVMPRRRADFKIFDRKEQLGLNNVRMDDEGCTPSRLALARPKRPPARRDVCGA
jgi:hypothetical protein